MDQAAQGKAQGKAQDDPAKDGPMAPPAALADQVAQAAVVAPARSSRPSMPIAMA
jgi:hypothetical protein